MYISKERRGRRGGGSRRREELERKKGRMRGKGRPGAHRDRREKVWGR